LLVGVHLPHQLAVAGADAVEHAFGPVQVDPVAVHHGAAARPAVVAVAVPVVRRVLEHPERLGRLGVPAAEAVAVAEAVEQPGPPFARSPPHSPPAAAMPGTAPGASWTSSCSEIERGPAKVVIPLRGMVTRFHPAERDDYFLAAPTCPDDRARCASRAPPPGR